jgi:chorismate synthase
MQARIRQAMEARDTLGGIIEVVSLGVPAGLGSYSQWDRRLDSRLGAALLSIPAIKGVEIGPAFANARLPGTQVHDAIRLDNDALIRGSNRAGGIEAAMKPIATTLTPQQTVNLANGEETPTVYERSDFCPVPRAVVVAEGMIAYVLADALLEKLGGDSLAEIDPRFQALRKTTLTDLPMAGKPVTFWPTQPPDEPSEQN